MKQDELQIGDLVQSFPDTGKIDGIVCLREEHTAEEKWFAVVHLGGNKYERVNVGTLNPIPLTGEILKNNGFFYDGKNYILSYKDGTHDVALYISEMYMMPGFVTGTPDIKSNKPYRLNVFGTLHYVHELQHLLKFLKTKKEIVL
jgi:hypothetical protein